MTENENCYVCHFASDATEQRYLFEQRIRLVLFRRMPHQNLGPQ